MLHRLTWLDSGNADKPFHLAVSAPAALVPLSPSSPSSALPNPVLSHFRHPSTPKSLSAVSKLSQTLCACTRPSSKMRSRWASRSRMAAHADESTSSSALSAAAYFTHRNLLPSSTSLAAYPHNCFGRYPVTLSPPLPLHPVFHAPLRPCPRASPHPLHPGAGHTHRWIATNELVSQLASFSLSARKGEGEDDLPLLAQYTIMATPVVLDHFLAFQKSEEGYWLAVSMREKRWERVMRAVEELEQES
ncbi:hypothetical protein JCM8097_008160 [Rhodosporidiobolus ruineniae]